MRNLFIIIFSIISVFNFTGCNQNFEQNTREPVVINLPADNTVNGYRTENSNTSSESDIIEADKVTVESRAEAVSSQNNTQSEEIQYCANLKSKIFHLSSCKSVNTMKEENKFFTKDKALLTEQGYSPCKSCNP